MSSVEKPQMYKKSRNRSRSWFLNLIRRVFKESGPRQPRKIRFEPLEARQLMAADFFASASWYANYSYPSTSTTTADSAYYAAPAVEAFSVDTLAMDTASLNAEGEGSPNLVEFAKALQQAGVRFFGADWCPLCTEQKNLFQDGKSYLPFVEMTNPDRTRNETAIQENVTQYPTWEFANGTRVTGVQSLEQLSTLSGVPIPTSAAPSAVDIPNQTVLNGSPLHVPVDAYSPSGGPLTITVQSSDPSVISAEMLATNKSLRLVVNGYGEMVFRLFETEASRPVQRIEELVNSGFYNETASGKIIFHRIIDNFMIQTGDPTGTGSGGSTLGDFDDQFNFNLQHNRSGVLSYAKSGDDTNDSQFFITETATRYLDFNHSIFGQLVEGESVREGISRTPTNSSDRPLNEISIKSAEIFNDTENGLIRLKALANSGSAVITVTITDSSGAVTTKQFTANAAADTVNGGPFLSDVTVPASIPAGQPTSIQLVGNDVEGDPMYFEAAKQGSVDYTYTIDHATGLLTVTPPANYTGQLQVLVAVRPQSGSSGTNDLWDTQVLTFNVANGTSTTTLTLDLDAASDSGSSNTDNITNASSMTFTVTGTTAGATVELKIGSTVVGSAVATGTTTSITTTQISAMGQGTRSIVATQTVNGVTSDPSAALSLVYDSVTPDAISASQLPAFANVGTALTFDLAHSEEGQGLQYSLTSPPSGMTIDSSTGVLSWTPTAAQLGAHTITLNLTDRAGNVRQQTFQLQVADQALVSVRLVPSDVNGNALTSLMQGQEFYLRIIVTDLRTTGSGAGDGIFSAYMDIEYDPNLFELTGNPTVEFNFNFGNGQLQPITTTPGLLNELGAFSSFTVGPGRTPQVLGAIAMRAKASGQATFTANPAETPRHGMAVFNVQGLISNELVNFIQTTIPVGQDFVVNNDTFNFNEDSRNNVLDVLANDTIVTGSSTILTIDTVGTPSHGGAVTISTDGKTLIYTPKADYFGQETFTYTAKDQTGRTGTATVTVQVNPVNDNPIANPDTYTTVKVGDQNVFLNVLANDTMGPDTGETLTVIGVGTPSQGGTATIGSAGNGIVYTPKAGFSGTETFTYTISDGLGGTASSTVTVVVGQGVTPPTAVNDTYTILEDAAAAEYDVLANDTPAVTGDTLIITNVGAPNGTVSISSNGTKITYAPKANANGTELVTYTIKSTNGGIAQGTVTFNITAVNDPPNAVDDVLTVSSQPNQIVDVLANDINPDVGETITITAVTQPPTGSGTITIGSNGKNLVYNAPNTSFTGTFTFTYTISDGTSTDTATVTLTVVDYIPRNVGVSLTTNLQGLPVTVSRNTVGSNGQSSYQTVPELNIVRTGTNIIVTNTAPGELQFSVPQLPFLNGTAQSVVVKSEVTDGDSISTPLNVGTLQAKYVDLRSFMGKNLGSGMTAAVSANQSSHWIDTKSGWENYSNLSITMNSEGTQITIKATNPSNQSVQATILMTDSRIQIHATEGSARMIRLRGTPAQIFTTT